MISQTTEPEYKTAAPVKNPTPVIHHQTTIKQQSSPTDLSAIAIKSMQIAEDKAIQNNGSASRQQAELQRILEQYFNK